MYLQQQQHHQHHHALLINSNVIMEIVSHRATSVMVIMTVEITVMKLDVIVQMIQIVQMVQVCTIYMCNVQYTSVKQLLKDMHLGMHGVPT